MAVTDYAAAIAVVRRSYDEAAELADAIFKKINDRKTEVETRRKTLEDIVSDRTCPASTRTLARIELDELAPPDLIVSNAEKSAFIQSIQQGQDALRDMYAARNHIAGQHPHHERLFICQ